MTVQELIKILVKHDPKDTVKVDGKDITYITHHAFTVTIESAC
jgi:hypothetical protein